MKNIIGTCVFSLKRKESPHNVQTDLNKTDVCPGNVRNTHTQTHTTQIPVTSPNISAAFSHLKGTEVNDVTVP